MKREKTKHLNIKPEYYGMFILSLLFFYGIDVDGLLYFAVAVSIWLLMNSRYSHFRNAEYYSTFTDLAVINFLVYVFSKVVYRRNSFRLPWDVILLVLYAARLAWFKFFTAREWKRQQEKERPDHGQAADLYQERQHDAEELRKYLRQYNAIGIDGVWGSGKTVLVNSIVSDPEMRKRHIFVPIHLLSVDFDKIQDIIIREIGRSLEAEGIFSSGVSDLLRWMKNDSWTGSFMKLFIPDNSTYTDAMRNLKRNLDQLDGRSIVVIYEDIDRVRDTDNIRKLFSLSENLTGASVKFLYEFDEKRLASLDEGFTRDYMEKYIPHVIKLTPISVRHIFQDAMENLKPEYLKPEDLEILSRPVVVNSRIQKATDAPKLLTFHMTPSSIRKVNIFLEDIDAALSRNKIYREGKNRNIVVAYYTLQHFLHEIYEEMDLTGNVSMMEQLLFRLEDGRKAAVTEMIRCGEAETRLRDRNQERAEEESDPADADLEFISGNGRKDIWDEDDNRARLWVLSVLGYDFGVIQSAGHRLTHAEIVQEEPRNLRRRSRNDEIDHLIRSLGYSGRSGMTDQQFVYRKMCEEVLSKPRQEWEEAYSRLYNKLSHDQFDYEDNHTSFRVGVDPMTELFQAFDVSFADKEAWLKLLDFYWTETKSKDEDGNLMITAGLLQPLNFVDLKFKEVYLAVLKTYNGASIVGNLNTRTEYHTFLERYLTALSSLGYIDTDECEYLQIRTEGIVDGAEWRVFAPMKGRIEAEKQQLSFSESAVGELNTILAFIDKNLELYKIENPVPPRRPSKGARIATKVVFRNQETIDRLLSEYTDEGSLHKALEVEYLKGNLTAHEMNYIVRVRAKGEETYGTSGFH